MLKMMNRLDIRVTELVNRIVMEHEERVKNHVKLIEKVFFTNLLTGRLQATS